MHGQAQVQAGMKAAADEVSGRLVGPVLGRLERLMQMYAHTQQLCCAMVSLGFIAHRDVLSAGLFLSLFALILISSRSITIAWWRWAIWTMEFRIVLVKFIQAWPTDRLFAAGPDSEGIDLTPYQRVLHLGSPGWDVVLLLALILHRQHLLRRGEWIDRKAGAEMRKYLQTMHLTKI